MFDKVTDKVREAPPPSMAPAQVGTDGEKTAAHVKESERRGNVVNESFSIPGITKAILEHLHIHGAAPERAASTHVGTTEIAARTDKVAEARDRGHGDSAGGMGDVKQLSRRPPGGEGTREAPASAAAAHEIPAPAQQALDKLVAQQRSLEQGKPGNGDQLFASKQTEDQNKHDAASGGQDVGATAISQNEHHLGFRQAVEQAFVNLKLRQIIDKFSSGPIGSTTFTHDEIESAFAVQSLTGHIVTNFQQEFASDRPPEPLGVDKLAITERDGRILLTTPEGTALVNQQGKPVMATELGSYLHKDGTVMVDGQGRLHSPGDMQHARTAQQEHLTANHRKEAEKVRVRQEMEASLDSVSSRDALAESMRFSRPELMQAIIDSAEQSVGKGEKESVNRTEALYLARRIMEDKEIDEIADSEFEVSDEEIHPDKSSSDGSVEPPGESELEESTEGETQETDGVADYGQKEVLRQGQTAILNQQGNNGTPDEDKKQNTPRKTKGQSSSKNNQTQSQQDPDPDQQDPDQQQTPNPQQPAQSTQSQVHLATIERLLTDLSGIVASASANYDTMVEAQASSLDSQPDRQPQTDTLPLPAMPHPAQQQSRQVEPAENSGYAIQSRTTHSQVMYRTNIGEVISVSAGHLVTNMFY
jgi:hypothetical protein